MDRRGRRSLHAHFNRTVEDAGPYMHIFNKPSVNT